jgi:uncharacterized protein (TIGR04255 family)
MTSRLPNAPLTEVVFEMHWGLMDEPGMPPNLLSDPGYPAIVDSFTTFAKKSGFGRLMEMQRPEYGGFANAVSRRFYEEGDEDFPLLQIGPGIFAANHSSGYDWASFRKMAENGACHVVGSYPKFHNFALEIKHLELRYIDVFEEDLSGTSGYLDFVERATNMDLQLPPFLVDRSLLGVEKRMRVQCDADVKGMANTIFAVDLGSARRGDKPVIRLESKVVSKADKVISVGRPASFQKKLGEWLEKAHCVSSPFFKDFIVEDVFSKFK